MMSFPLLEALLDHGNEDPQSRFNAAHEESLIVLEELLTRGWDEAILAWPKIALTREHFLAHLALHVDMAEELSQLNDDLAGMRWCDLYLACGCCHGDQVALTTLGETFLGQMELRLWELPNYDEMAQEIRQRVWEKLIAPADGSVPKIQQYAGRGSLKSWLQTVVTREALALLRKQKQLRGQAQSDDEEVFWRLACPQDDQEERYLKQLYREAFKDAFQDALASMPPRDRTILKYHYIDGLSSEQIGRIYRVHRATVARWLQRIREDLLSATATQMHRRLGLSEEGTTSLFRLIQSQLDLSLMRLLA